MTRPLPWPLRFVAAGPFVVVLLTALGAGGDPAPRAEVAAPRALRVFVAGHSFHMPMADPLNQIAQAAGVAEPVLAGRQGIGGSSVTKHWDVAEAKNKAKQAIKAGDVDVLTLAPFHTPLPDPAIEKFTALLLEHNPNGRVTVQASWVPMDGFAADRATFTNTKRDDADPTTFYTTWASFTNKLRDQVRSLNQEFARAGRPVVLLVPVGDAVIRLRERVVKGEVPGIAKQSELFRDNLGHGKAPISVLTAYCHYAVIFGRNPIGLPAPAALKAAGLGEKTEALNRVLQEVAWQVVTAEPLSGVAAPEADR